MRSTAALTLFLSLAGFALTSGTVMQQPRFTDRFDGDLSGWNLTGAQAIGIVESGDPDHGPVLELRPDGWDVFALVRGSETWGNVAVDGEMMFPHEGHSYLGFLYNVTRTGRRVDFGNLYVKGNGSYIRVNPHRDGNVGRTLYEEYNTPLTGVAQVRVGEWQRFRLEVAGAQVHLYVGDLSRPQITFDHLELDSGPVGFQPRCCGQPVWLDNIRVAALDGFSYAGPPIPGDEVYEPHELLTDWQVIGPLLQADKTIERARDGSGHPWRPMPVDGRGAVITARITDYEGPRSFAYFSTQVESSAARPAALHLSTVDNLQVWVNGKFIAHFRRHELAWYDFWKNPEHEGYRLAIDLQPGRNHLLLRSRGGEYAAGGFFARLE